MWIDDPPRPLALGSAVKFSSFFGIGINYFCILALMCLFSISGFLFRRSLAAAFTARENAIASIGKMTAAGR